MCAIGDASHRTSLYGSAVCLNGTSTAVTSDERLKKDFTQFDERHMKLFMDLEPLMFRYKANGSNRLHSGFVAQKVKKSLDDNHISTTEFGAYVEDVADELFLEEQFGEDAPLKSTDKQLWLRYEEFIPLNTYMIQNTRKEVSYQAGRINAQETVINDFQSRLEQVEKEIKELKQAAQ